MCYRCGVGTTDPVRKPVPIKEGGRGGSLVVGIVPLLLALAALIAGEASGYPREMDIAAGILASLGVMLLIVRLRRRR